MFQILIIQKNIFVGIYLQIINATKQSLLKLCTFKKKILMALKEKENSGQFYFPFNFLISFEIGEIQEEYLYVLWQERLLPFLPLAKIQQLRFWQ